MKGNYESLQSLVAEIERIETVKHDYLVPTKNINMVEDNFFEFGGKEEFKIEPHTHQQLSEYTGIPKRYYDKMMEIPGLRTQNVNAWLHNATDKKLVRTLEGSARAILSDRFKPIDHILLLHSFLPAIQGIDVKIQSNSLTPTKMYIQILFPKISGEVEVGDIIQSGITLTNSETGQGSIDVSTFLYRLSCKNGMVGSSLLHKYHVGRRVGEDIQDYNIYADDTIKAELESFKLRFRDIMKHAISETAFQEQLNKMRKAAGIEVITPLSVIEEVTKQYFLSEEESKMLANNFFSEKKTVWGLANSVTALAHNIENPDRQYQMERIGNDIVLSPEQWKEVA